MKTKEQLIAEIKEKKKKMDERKNQRKMDSILTLKNIDLKIKKGNFVCIIGKVGSGKSSLLSTIIGETLPVPQKMIDSYSGSEGLKKELNDQEA